MSWNNAYGRGALQFTQYSHMHHCDHLQELRELSAVCARSNSSKEQVEDDETVSFGFSVHCSSTVSQWVPAFSIQPKCSGEIVKESAKSFILSRPQFSHL